MNNKLRAAIAGVIPDSFRISESGEFIWHRNGHDCDCDPETDLNVAHHCWMTLDGNERVRYSIELAGIVARDLRMEMDDCRLSIEGIVENATANQRIEAFVRLKIPAALSKTKCVGPCGGETGYEHPGWLSEALNSGDGTYKP